MDGNYEFLIHRLDECQSTMTFVSEERMLLFGLVLTLPKLWVAVPCHAAVCFSGHARSFMHPHVREHLKERLLQGLECETDVFFYLALGEAHGSARNAWDNFTRQPMVAPEVVRAGGRRHARAPWAGGGPWIGRPLALRRRLAKGGALGGDC